MFRHILKFESNYAFRLSLSAWILLIPLLIHIPNPQWWTMTRCPLQSVGLVGTTVRCLNASEICCLSLDLACLLLHLWRPLQHRPPTLQLYNLVSVKYSGHQRIYLVLCVSISACDCPFPIPRSLLPWRICLPLRLQLASKLTHRTILPPFIPFPMKALSV